MKIHLHPRKSPSDTVTKCLAFILGATAMIGQIILLRELISIFYGNETAYGIILGSWLFWVACGSFVVSRIPDCIKRPINWLTICLGLQIILSPATIVLIRCVRHVLQIKVGTVIGIIPMTSSCFVMMAPLTFVLGATFSLLCSLGERHGKAQPSFAIGGVYLWESVGAAMGGALYSLLLIKIIPAFLMAVLVGVINLIAVTFLRGWKDVLSQMSLCLGFLIIVFLMFGGGQSMDNLTRQWQWKGLNVIDATDSIYGNVVLTQMDDEYTLFENGILSFSTDNEAAAEESVHYALLEHPQPENVLLVGNGLGGALKEILKHPVKTIDYLELDPTVMQMAKSHLPDKMIAALKDPRVTIKHLDGRLYIKNVVNRYDVIIINLADPYTAMINRYYTVDFFKESSEALRPNGIISLNVSSGENYINQETRDFLRSIHSTLKQVFSHVISIPGESNIFLAGTQASNLSVSPELLIERIRQRQLQNNFVHEYFIPDKLSHDRLTYINQVLQEDGQINTDLHPIAYYFDIILWSTHFNLHFKRFMQWIEGITFIHLAIFIVVFLIGGWFSCGRIPALAVTASIFTTGFSEIIFQLIVIIAFQTLYGFAFYKIGFIMTSFMIGLIFGSFLARKCIQQSNVDCKKIYLLTQICIVIYPVLLPFLFVLFKDITTPQNTGLFNTIFAMLPIMAGLIGGLQYPLATHINFTSYSKGKTCTEFAGGLYAADTWGAMIGSLLAGAVLIPILGIKTLAYFCALLNFIVLVLLWRAFHPAR